MVIFAFLRVIWQYLQ